MLVIWLVSETTVVVVYFSTSAILTEFVVFLCLGLMYTNVGQAISDSSKHSETDQSKVGKRLAPIVDMV